MNKEHIPVFSWNTETKEFYVLGHKFDGVNSVEDFINFLVKLQQENQKLKKQLETLEKTNKQLISKLDRYDAIVDERDELKKQLRTSAIFNEEDIRLDQTKEVFETLANILNTESCSYRYLIYDLLGFKKENYIDLIAGMSITNAIVELEELENQQKEFIEYMEDKINKIKEEIRTFDIWHEAGVDINFLILKKQFFVEILNKYKEIIGVKNE